MILSGNRILKEIKAGNILIDPFDIKRMNPNSYNVRLAEDLLTYDHSVLDMKREEPYTIERIPDSGKLLIPGKIYLARTIEHSFTRGFVPMLEGRSSIGRLGLFVHATAGFGDNGFDGYWTLELSCVQPIIIYSGVEIAQLYYCELSDIDGDGELGIPVEYSSGKYQKNTGVQPSMLWKDFKTA